MQTKVVQLYLQLIHLTKYALPASQTFLPSAIEYQDWFYHAKEFLHMRNLSICRLDYYFSRIRTPIALTAIEVFSAIEVDKLIKISTRQFIILEGSVNICS